MNIDELKDRWIQILRQKAHEFEHPARGRGEVVCEPSLDVLCNEMEAFFIGLNS